MIYFISQCLHSLVKQRKFVYGYQNRPKPTAPIPVGFTPTLEHFGRSRLYDLWNRFGRFGGHFDSKTDRTEPITPLSKIHSEKPKLIGGRGYSLSNPKDNPVHSQCETTHCIRHLRPILTSTSVACSLSPTR